MTGVRFPAWQGLFFFCHHSSPGLRYTRCHILWVRAYLSSGIRWPEHIDYFSIPSTNKLNTFRAAWPPLLLRVCMTFCLSTLVALPVSRRYSPCMKNVHPVTRGKGVLQRTSLASKRVGCDDTFHMQTRAAASNSSEVVPNLHTLQWRLC